MAFYYVKSGGIATGNADRVTSAHTGSFATMGVSVYYDSFQDLSSVPTTGFDNGFINLAISGDGQIITTVTRQ